MKNKTNARASESAPKHNREAMLNALLAFINQRSGIQFADYASGDWKQSRAAFMGDYRPMLRNGRIARQLLRAVRLRESITAEKLIEATHTFSGRLQFRFRDDGSVACDYTTGQYFPTEYRSAACAVLASALWDYWRENMPQPDMNTAKDGNHRFDGLSAGDFIRRQARREFGRGIAAAWFN